MHDRPEGSKISRYQIFKQVEKSTGKEPAQLKDRPPFSPALANAWAAFESIMNHTWVELQAFIILSGVELECWEVKAVMKLAAYKEAKPVWPPK